MRRPQEQSPKHIDKKYKRAMKRALARKPFFQSDGKYLSREQIHNREQFRDEK